MKILAARIFAKFIHYKNQKWIINPIKYQNIIFKKLLKKGAKTQFGKDHSFNTIKSYNDFSKKVPVRDYEAIRPYIDKVLDGKKDILWPNKPLYLAKTSGTTSGVKYIPITKDSIYTHSNSARDAILNYIYNSGNTELVLGKHIFIQGSPVLKINKGIFIGRLSGIAAHYVPKYLQKNRVPSWETNSIEDWELKIQTIVDETINENMTVIAGIPSWVQMYFEKINERVKKKTGDQFKKFSLFVYGGVNFEPYKSTFNNLIGRKVDSIELYPASEGFFAYQDVLLDSGLLLLVNNGIYYEFIEVSKFYDKNPNRLTLKDVKKGINYVMIISTTAGLWAYNIGDTIEFSSLKPFKIKVTGRINHFISAFGEHVIGSEVEKALKLGVNNFEKEILVREFTVAPQIKPQKGLPYHEWFIEFETLPKDLKKLEKLIDQALQDQNIYYKDLISGKILKSLLISVVPKNGFNNYMKKIGKLGGQNKVPRLSNDRKIANILNEYITAIF